MVRLRVSLVAVLAMCAATAGCNQGKSPEAYVPTADASRQALEAALSAWKSGKPMADIQSEGLPKVTPLDSDWKNKKKLESYSIGNEVPTTEGPKKFAVKLTLQGAPPVDTVFYVVGINPLWVYREADYLRQSGM